MAWTVSFLISFLHGTLSATVLCLLPCESHGSRRRSLESGKSIEDADGIELEKKAEEVDEEANPVREMPVSMEPPHVRFNAQLAVQDDVLYIYGGTFEKGDREFTFDDLYAVDL